MDLFQCNDPIAAEWRFVSEPRQVAVKLMAFPCFGISLEFRYAALIPMQKCEETVFFFNPVYLVFIAPAILLMAWAQYRVKSTYARAMQMPAPLSGAAAARFILDQAGLQDVPVEPTQ